MTIVLLATSLPVAMLCRGGLCQSFPLVIDPGHGASDPGANTAIQGYYEKNVNLSVALALAESLRVANYKYGLHYYLTRVDDTTYLDVPTRAEIAVSLSANEFICVHHNWASTPATNYERVNYCTDRQTPTDPPLWRDTSALLASKVGHRIEQVFGLTYSQCPGSISWPCDRCELYVLNYTNMASVLTEASFVTNPDEANAFYSGNRAAQEGGAIFHGWRSYKTNGGFAIVRSTYNGGVDGTVNVDGVNRSSPHIEVWERGEAHELKFRRTQVFQDGVQRPFFRWAYISEWQAPRDTGLYQVVSYDTVMNVLVGAEFAYHIWAAFYRGGPYTAQIFPPAETVFVGDTVTIPWTVDPGADSTSAVTIDLDRNGGAGGFSERIFGRSWFDYMEGWRWVVSGATTENARLRIKADDYAGNSAVDTS